MRKVISSFSPGLADEFECGDVVLVRTEDGQEVIKRIIAVPEETLYIDTPRQRVCKWKRTAGELHAGAD